MGPQRLESIRHRAPCARRRGSARRRGPARPQGAPRPDLGADPAGRCALGRLCISRSGRRSASCRSSTSPCCSARSSCSRDTRDFARLLRIGQVDILLAPTLSMIPLGGFLAGRRRRPLGDPRAARGARLHERPVGGPLVRRLGRRLPRIGDRGRAHRPGLAAAARLVHEHDAGPEHRRRRHHRVHPAGACSRSSGAMRWRRSARSRQKAENLLLNILPRSIADRLKAETQPIADQFGSASILFADVVDFTPWSERLDARRGGRLPRSPLQPLRRARGAVRAREDQDHRRLLHGRRGRSRRRAPTTLARSR